MEVAITEIQPCSGNRTALQGYYGKGRSAFPRPALQAERNRASPMHSTATNKRYDCTRLVRIQSKTKGLSVRGIVWVTAYVRFRFGRFEHVCAHWRGMPK